MGANREGEATSGEFKDSGATSIVSQAQAVYIAKVSSVGQLSSWLLEGNSRQHHNITVKGSSIISTTVVVGDLIADAIALV